MTKKLKLKLKYFFKNHDWKVMIKFFAFILILFLILFDQVVKFYVTKNLTKDVEYSFLPGFINLKYVINYGSAFGLNQNKTTLLITIAFLVAIILLVWFAFSSSTTTIIGISFIFSGTVGNLSDRFRNNGGVIDYLMWDMFNPKTIFNIADILVTIGIIIIVVYWVVEVIKSIVDDRKLKKAKNSTHARKSKTV